jgi:hypothetical protein
MSAIIVGKKIPGYNVAKDVLEKIFPQLLKEFPDISGVHKYGTLNIGLMFPLRVLSPDHTTALIENEIFSFTKIKFQLNGQQTQRDAWIFIPHNSPHRGNSLSVEILMETIEINDEDVVLLHLPPYRYSSCIVL